MQYLTGQELGMVLTSSWVYSVSPVASAKFKTAVVVPDIFLYVFNIYRDRERKEERGRGGLFE